MIQKIALSVLLSVFVSLPALTDEMGPGGDKFYEEAAHFENACQVDPCKAPYKKALVYHQQDRIEQVAENTKKRLREIAHEQTAVWGDTILEGDYYSSGRTRLDEVVAFYKNDQIVGYKIRYSQKAWALTDCAFNGSRESLNHCREGRIIEGSYVSADTLTYFSDEERYAEFSFSAN